MEKRKEGELCRTFKTDENSTTTGCQRKRSRQVFTHNNNEDLDIFIHALQKIETCKEGGRESKYTRKFFVSDSRRVDGQLCDCVATFCSASLRSFVIISLALSAVRLLLTQSACFLERNAFLQFSLKFSFRIIVRIVCLIFRSHLTVTCGADTFFCLF